MTLKNKYSIAEGIKKLAGNKRQTDLLLAEVKSVNKDNGILVIDCPWLGLTDLTINYHPATTQGKNFALWPVVGSPIVVGKLEGTDQLFVVGVITPEVVELRGGDWSMVKGEEIKAEVEKLKSLVDALISVINATPGIPEPGNGSPSAFQAAIKSAISGKSTGDYSNILNEKVKHG